MRAYNFSGSTAAEAPGARPKAGVVCRLEDGLEPGQAARFDEFGSAGDHASYMQTTAWVELAPSTTLRRFAYLTCEEGGRLTVTGLVRLTRLFPGRYLAKLQRGPVFHDIEAFDRALPRIFDALRSRGACTVLMNPRWEDEGARKVEQVLAAHGMRQLAREEQVMHSTTGLVDLQRPEDEIFGGFQKRCQRDIKRAVKKGLVVRHAESEGEAALLRRRRKELAELRNIDDLGQPDLVDQWRSFNEGEKGVLLLAEAEGQVIGGLAVACEGERAVIRGGGAMPILPKLPRTHNLIWESMRILKADGCTAFDLAGMPDDEDIEEDERRRQKFKEAFNPRIVKLVPTYCAPLRAFDHAVLFSARQWYRRSPLRRLISPLLRRG